jgi:YidC/Oxa1 family membrane protein insertase
MDNLRLFLFLALSFLFLLMWEAWQRDFAPAQEPIATSAPVETAPSAADVPTPVVAPAAGDAAAAPLDAASAAPASQQRIRVKTDTFDIELDTVGGDVRSVKLPRYPVSVERRDKPMILLSDKGQPFFIAQTGLLSKSPAPDHYATFVADKNEYVLPEGADSLRVPLTWTSPDGVRVTKAFIFERGSYAVTVEQKVENGSSADWSGRQYRQFQRSSHGSPTESSLLVTYTGGVLYSPEKKYEKISFSAMKDANLGRDITGGWAAMIQHYFVGAWVPNPDEQDHYYSKVPAEDRHILGLVSPELAVAPGHSAVFTSKLYMGPKLQDDLAKLAPGLDLTVDYGWLTVIAKPIFWLLSFIHDLVKNWGVAIILLTLLIKLAFYKLSEASYRSMAHMRRMQPKLVAIKERYGDDRQRLSQAMMDLYKKEKINPFGGCLPILVQIPVFIALYWVLLESVELRQAPFVLWIEDMSTKDPYYVLPLIMGVSMFIQQKLNPPPPDPMQAKILMMLPIVFTAFFAFFPAGLVLYWCVNSILSIAQQWYITRRVEREAAAAVAKA